MAFLAATQLADDFLLATQPDLAVETDSDPEENVILPPQQVGVLVVDTEQRIGVEEYPLFLGCNIIGRDITDIPGADEARQERLRQWRSENLEVHVEAIFVPEPSLSKTHAHIYLADGGLNCFVTALCTTNPSFMVPAGAASRAHTMSPGVRYNVRPDDVLRFGRLSCRVLCGPDWLARGQQQPLQQSSLPQQQQQQRLIRLQPWQGNGEAEYQQQGLDGRLGSEHHRGSPQHVQHRMDQGYSWQRQEQQHQGFISIWPSSPGAVKRPSGAAMAHGKAGDMEGLQAGRAEERLGGVVSGGAGIGPTAGSFLPAASADAVEGHTHGDAGATGQPGQPRFVPPTQDVLVGLLPQLPEGQQHEAGMLAPRLQQHQHGPLPVSVMPVIALVPPQGAGAAGGLSRPDTLTAAAGAVGPGPSGAVHGAVQPSGAVLVQLYGGARALLPGDAAAAMLPLQVQMPFPLAQVVSETEEEEEDGEGEFEAEEKGKDAAAVAPRAGTTAPPAPPAPWWELADSLDDTHDGAWGASQSAGRPEEADTDTGSPGPGGGAEVLHLRAGEEAGNRSRQHPSRPLSVKLEPVDKCGELQSANGVQVSGVEHPDEDMRPHSVGDDDRSVCDDDAVMCDLTQPPDEEVLGVAPGDGFVTADDAGDEARVREQQENQHQLPCSSTELGPGRPRPVGPSPPQEAYSDDDTAPPSPPSPSPSLSDAANHVGASEDEETSRASEDKAGTGGGRIMASGGADVRSHLLVSTDLTRMVLAERVPQMAAAAAPVVPPTQLVETSLVPPPMYASVPPPPQQQHQLTCPSHSLQMDSHQGRFGQVVQPQCRKQQRRSSYPEGREWTDRSVWGVHGMAGEAGGGHELLPDAVGGCRRLLLGILTDPSPSSSPNPDSDGKVDGKPVSTDHHQHPEDLKPHFAPLRYPAAPLLQRLEDQHQLQPSLRPRTAAVVEALSKSPSPTVHGNDVGASKSLPAAAVAATIGPGIAATVGIPAVGTEPPCTGPLAPFNISQSASPWDLNAVQQRVGRLVSLLCSAESSEPSQEELLQPRQLQQPLKQMPSGRRDAGNVATLGGPGQEGPAPRADAVEMAPSGPSMPLSLVNEQPPPAQPQPLLRQQLPEQHPLLLNASAVAVPPTRAAGEMQSLTGAAANAELLPQPRPPLPSPIPPGSPSVSVRSFVMPGFGTQIAADALQQLMMAESAPDRNAESSPCPRLDAAAAELRLARDTVLTHSAAELDHRGNPGREMQVLGGAYRGGRVGGGGRGRIGGAKVEQFGYSNADYVYEFPADAGDDGDEDYVQTPRRGRGRGRGARGGRGRGGRGSKGARGAGKPPTGLPRSTGAKRRASGTPNEVSPTGGAGSARVPPPGKRSRHGSREASPVPQGADESHHQPQQQQLFGELSYDLQCRALQQQQQQQQQQQLQQQLLLQLQQQGLIGIPSAVSQPVPAKGPKGRGRGRPPASGRGCAALTMAAAADLAAAGVAIAPGGPHVAAERTPGSGTAAQIEAVVPKVGQLASPRLQWATRRRRTSASLSREGSAELLQGSGSSGQSPPPPPPHPSPHPQTLPVLSSQGPSPLLPTPSAPRPQDDPPLTLAPEVTGPLPLSPSLQRHQGEMEQLSPERQPASQHQTSPELVNLQQRHLQRHDQVSPTPSPLQPQPQQQQDVQEDPSTPTLDDEMQHAHHDGGDDGSHLVAFPIRRAEPRPRSSTGIGSPGGTRGEGALRDADGSVAVAEPCTFGVATVTGAAAAAPLQEDPSLRHWEEAQTARRRAGGEDAVKEPPHAPGTTSTPVGTTSATAATGRPFKRPRMVAASVTTAAAAAGTAAAMGPASEPPSVATVEGPETSAEHDKREPASATTHALPKPEPELQPQPQRLQELNPQQQQQLPGLGEAQQLHAEQPAQQMRDAVGGVGGSGSGGRGGGRRPAPKRAGKRKAAALEELPSTEQEPVLEPGVEVKPEPSAEGLAETREPRVRSPGPSRDRLGNGAAAASPIGGVILAGPAVEEQRTPHGAGEVRGTSAPEGRPPLARRPPSEQQLQLEQQKMQQQQQGCSSCSHGEAAGAAPKRRSSTGARKPRASKARHAAAPAEADGPTAEKPDVVVPIGHDSSAAASPQLPRHAGSSPGVATGLRRRRVSSHNGAAGGSQLAAAEGGLAAPTASTAVIVSISRNIPERERNGLAAAVQQLGGRVAEDEEADAGGFTHLLLARNAFTTSMKVLAALAAGRPLLDAAWLNACRAAGMWLEPHSEHTAVDPKAEKQHKFRIWDAYRTTQREGPMLQGRTFYATPLRSLEDAKKVPAGASTGSGSKASKAIGRTSTGGAGRCSGAATASPPPAECSPGSGAGPAQGLALIAQLAGARLLVEAREVVAGETVVVGQPGELRWARQHLPAGTRVYDKDGFVQALLHQRLDGIKPAFVV